MTSSRSFFQKLLANFPWIIFSLITAFALLWKLGSGTLAAWDEAIYAQVSKEIVQSGSWLTLHWQHAPWFEKPPLFMWITAAIYRVVGINEFAARFPSALSGVLLLAVTYNIGRIAYSKRAGFLAAVILVVCYHFLSFSRFGTMEVMLTLFTYTAVYAYLRARNDQRWWYLVWAACGLGLMTKGAAGIIAPVALMLALFMDKRRSELKSRHFWQACVVALIIVLPWHVLMYARHGQEFIREYFGYHVIARATQTLEGHPTSYLYYIGRLIDGFFPIILIVPFAIVSEIRNRRKGGNASWVLAAFAVLTILVYTAVHTRRPWYIVPIYPALAILVGAFFIRFRQAYPVRPIVRRTITVCIVVLLALGGLYSVTSLMLNRRTEDPLAQLAGLARVASPAERGPLILFANGHYYYAQVPLFYSDRPVVQAYGSIPPASEDAKRYVSFIPLAEVVDGSEKDIILRRDEQQHLAAQYEIRVIAGMDELIYGKIKRKQ
ncbi:MAG TPA: glycosyltransferase family 39 protein [Pyrinomonadaceae bacterium]|nr:glycosyltransferase family 39 protein [Pyrinomonadaceae bacterium]